MRLDGIMLFAADLEAQAAFYRDVIGFRPLEETRHRDWVEFDSGGASFSLHRIPPELGVKPSPVPRETGSCKPFLAVDNLAETRERLAAAGVAILDRAWGGWDFADPEGNVIGVRERE